MSTTVNDPAVRAAVAAWEDEGGPALVRSEGAVPLDWEAFTARFYPGARRHRYEPLAAYVAYRRDTPTTARTR